MSELIALPGVMPTYAKGDRLTVRLADGSLMGAFVAMAGPSHSWDRGWGVRVTTFCGRKFVPLADVVEKHG